MVIHNPELEQCKKCGKLDDIKFNTDLYVWLCEDRDDELFTIMSKWLNKD